MKINHKPIKTREQFEIVANRIEQLRDAKPHTAEAVELKLLTELVVEYASKDGGSAASPEQSQMT